MSDSKDCFNFFEDLERCIEKNSLYRGKLENHNYPQPKIFDFTECKEFKIFKKKNYLSNTLLEINLSELSYPYNRYYTITKDDNRIKIRLSD
jgi:hypothetical protein